MSATTPYDELRYPGKFYSQAAPSRIATVATLFGLTPPSLEDCRVLELGCGEGGHLVPIAGTYPRGRALGIDSSTVAIERARAFAAQVEARNCTFYARDLRELPADAGPFDYIIAHGVYSWVPEAVRQAILAICARHLAPEGLAYVSYNAYPGGHVRQILRDLALFQTKDIADPVGKVREARRVAELIVGAMPANTLERHLFGRVLSLYSDSDALIRFDLLAEENEPVYFLDFMEEARALELEFVAESGQVTRDLRMLPEPVRAWLESAPERLVREQYLDFITCCGFRQTILCRKGRAVAAQPSRETLSRVHLRSSLAPITDFHDPGEVTFRDAVGRELSCTEAVAKAAYTVLGQAFPSAISYGDLRARIVERLGGEPKLDAATEDTLVRLLLQSDATGLIALYAEPPRFTSEISSRPRASRLSRVQAARDGHLTFAGASGLLIADPALCKLVPLLDGTRDTARLLKEWRASVSAARPLEPAALDRALRLLADSGLLLG